MKTKSKSLMSQSFWLGRIFLLGPLVVLLPLGCQTGEKSRSRTDLPEEVSLREDRDYLAKAREEIPAEVQRDNDELAFVLKLMGEVKERPDKIRDRWGSETRKRRDKFQAMNRREREEFNKNEKKSRDEFLKKAQKKRDGFVGGKVTPDERRSFFSEQETERRDFFAKQSEARREFDSEMRQRSSDFEAYMRDRNSEFNSEHRAYSDRYRQWEKEKRQFDEEKRKQDRAKQTQSPGTGPEVANSSLQFINSGEGSALSPTAGSGGLPTEDEALLREFDQIPKGPRKALGAGDGQ